MFKRAAKQEVAPIGLGGGGPGGAAVLQDELGLSQLWYLELRLSQELARSARTGAVFSLVAWRRQLLPGEGEDPELVRRAASVIASSLRSYDIAARLDVHRFAALLLDANAPDASTVAHRIQGDLQIRLAAAGRWQAGVATFQRDGVDADSLIQAALRRLEEDVIHSSGAARAA